jgi:hypothetical protein
MMKRYSAMPFESAKFALNLLNFNYLFLFSIIYCLSVNQRALKLLAFILILTFHSLILSITHLKDLRLI